jgi:hypothetical protein
MLILQSYFESGNNFPRHNNPFGKPESLQLAVVFVLPNSNAGLSVGHRREDPCHITTPSESYIRHGVATLQVDDKGQGIVDLY